MNAPMLAFTQKIRLKRAEENWNQAIWQDAYAMAARDGFAVQARLGKHDFEYALVNSERAKAQALLAEEEQSAIYAREDLVSLVKGEEQRLMVGINLRGLAFVFEKLIPQRQFSDFVGLHEYAEAHFDYPSESRLDWYRATHIHGCRTELTELFRQEPAFVASYADWVCRFTREDAAPQDGYFGRAIPGFEKLVLEGRMNPAELLAEFKRRLDAGEYPL
jgi:hypothetical protein